MKSQKELKFDAMNDEDGDSEISDQNLIEALNSFETQ